LFQSTPPRGGRPETWPSRARIATNRFNPRPRAGGDPHSSRSQGDGGDPGFNPRPRAGGDVARVFPMRVRMRFNPRPRAGGDLVFYDGFESGDTFQSTPPRGGRHGGHQRWIQSFCFNPRPRAGGDRD